MKNILVINCILIFFVFGFLGKGISYANPKVVELRYLKGLIKEEKIKEISLALEAEAIEFRTYDYSKEPQLCLWKIAGIVAVNISSNIISDIIYENMNQNIIDVLKKSLKYIWNDVIEKKTTWYKLSGKEKRKTNFVFYFKVGEAEIRFVLDEDYPDKLKQKCIDQAFNLLKTDLDKTNQDGYVATYNQVKKSWDIYQTREYLNQFVIPEDQRYKFKDNGDDEVENE